MWKNQVGMDSSINHVDSFLNIFNPLPPLRAILLNKAYVFIWTFGKPPPPVTWFINDP